jgi:hypothetical protein
MKRGKRRPRDDAGAQEKRLARIVTMLWLKSGCDRDLVDGAAAKLVKEKKGEILTSCSSRYRNAWFCIGKW